MSNLPKLKAGPLSYPGLRRALPKLRPPLEPIPEAAPRPARAQREEGIFEDSPRPLEFAAPTPCPKCNRFIIGNLRLFDRDGACVKSAKRNGG
jgi:hypothetical protein